MYLELLLLNVGWPWLGQGGCLTQADSMEYLELDRDFAGIASAQSGLALAWPEAMPNPS